MLESLGCARTLRNDNSSRYGKFITIRHDASGGVRAAYLDTYLLEKSRVTRRGDGEHNFHIFYELMHGADPGMRNDLQLTKAPEGGWAYLSDTANRTLATDQANFSELLKGFHAVGLPSKVRNQVLRTLAGILWLGQIRIGAGTNAQGEVHATIPDDEAVRVAAMLLGCDPADLFDGLCIRCIKAGSDWVKSQYTPAQARSVRDGFAQAIYAGVFRRVVEQANASLAADFPADGGGSHGGSLTPTPRLGDLGSSPRWSGAVTPRELGATLGARASPGEAAVAEPASSFVGLLDIFGFEALGVNSLEQICINYANEKLQDMFVSLMIERTQELYAAEGVRFDAAAVPKHDRGSMTLLDAIFRSLTEECVLPRGSDSQLLVKLLQVHEANPLFNTPPDKPAAGGSSQQRTAQLAAARRRERMVSFDTKTFVVCHFAGRVRYGVEGFLQKNRDPLSQDLQVMMQWSSVPLLARTFSVRSGTTSSKFHGVVERFLASLSALLATMGSANVHFIRCIKPNDAKQPNFVDSACVAKQVTSSGLVPAIGISRAGFSTHMSRHDFAALFGPPWERTTGGVLRQPVDNAQLLLLLEWVGAKPDEYCIGKSRIFLRHGVLSRLELVRYSGLDKCVVMVQAAARRRIAIQAVAKRREEQLHPAFGSDCDYSSEEDKPNHVVDSSRVLRGDSFSRRLDIRKSLDLADDEEAMRRKASFDRKCRKFGTVVKTRRPAAAERRGGGGGAADDEFEMTGGGMGSFSMGGRESRRRGETPAGEDYEQASGRSRHGLKSVGSRGERDRRDASPFIKVDSEEEEEEAGSQEVGSSSAWSPPTAVPPTSAELLTKQAAAEGERAMMAEIEAGAVDQALKWPLEYVVEYAKFMEMVLPEDVDLLWIADEALSEGEQPDWEECLDIRGGLYFQHRVAGTVLTQHPIDFHYQRFYYYCKVDPALRKDLPPAVAEEVGLARDLSLTRAARRPSAHLRATMPKNFELLHFETIIERREGHGLGVTIRRGNIIMAIQPAVECELQIGDRITAVDGQVMRGSLSIGSAIEPRNSHTLTIERWVPEYDTDGGNLNRALSSALAADGSEAKSDGPPSSEPFCGERSAPQYPEGALSPDSMAESEDALDSVFAVLPPTQSGRVERSNSELHADYLEVQSIIPLSASASPAASPENNFTHRQLCPASSLKPSSPAGALSGSPLNPSRVVHSRSETNLRPRSLLEGRQGRESRRHPSAGSPQAGEHTAHRTSKAIIWPLFRPPKPPQIPLADGRGAEASSVPTAPTEGARQSEGAGSPATFKGNASNSVPIARSSSWRKSVFGRSPGGSSKSSTTASPTQSPRPAGRASQSAQALRSSDSNRATARR